MISDFKKYMLEKKKFSLDKMKADFQLSVKKLNIQRNLYKMRKM